MMQKNGLRSAQRDACVEQRSKKGQQIIAQGIALGNIEAINTPENVVLTAYSIGAFFSMNAGIDEMIQKAFFISPIVNMEKLITDMMKRATVMEGGEHWFHTEKQMVFLDNWIKESI